MLETRTSYTLGDEIETNGHVGEVIEVNDRATVLLTRDQRRVHGPSLSEESQARDAVIRKLVSVMPAEGVTIPAPLLSVADTTHTD